MGNYGMIEKGRWRTK